MANEGIDGVQELVQKRGHPVHMHNDFCKAWKTEHENCAGCESELGCRMVVHVMAVMMIPMRHQAANFEDFQRMQNRIQELMQMCLDAKTADELREVPTV